MGWIDVLKETVKGLRTAGKNEQDIKEIITEAADKATATKGIDTAAGGDKGVILTLSAEGTALSNMQAKIASEFGVPEKVLRNTPELDEWNEYHRKQMTSARDALDALIYSHGLAAQAARARIRQESNNWRKMHGLPMRRKRGKADGRADRGHRH